MSDMLRAPAEVKYAEELDWLLGLMLADLVQAITAQLAELAHPALPVRPADRVDELEARIA